MYLLRRTDIYQGIQKTLANHLTNIDDVEEAEEVAWADRRFALKRFLVKNETEFEAKLFEEDVEDEDDSANDDASSV